LDKAEEVAAGLSFPVAWGVERTLADQLGAFWDEGRDFIQPTEFLISRKGRVFSSTYSSSPIGRIDPEEALSLVGALTKMRLQKQAQQNEAKKD
jgi:alkyl hydroperoxide reductase subunit AhpC